MTFRAVILSVSLSLVAFAIEPVNKSKIDERARAAKTAGEHAAVAVLYRDCAATSEKNADLHEAEAKRLAAEKGWVVTKKWPALAPQEVVKERELAAAARKDARQCAQSAAKHSRLGLL